MEGAPIELMANIDWTNNGVINARRDGEPTFVWVRTLATRFRRRSPAGLI
jgi:hypothetical protein